MNVRSSSGPFGEKKLTAQVNIEYCRAFWVAREDLRLLLWLATVFKEVIMKVDCFTLVDCGSEIR